MKQDFETSNINRHRFAIQNINRHKFASQAKTILIVFIIVLLAILFRLAIR
jgi:hypothetical protein